MRLRRRGTDGLPTLRWSGMDSNVQFRARWATVCGFVRVGSDGPAHGHPSSCRPRRTARVSGGGPGRRHSPPGSGGRHTKVALSAVRAHRGTEGSNPFPSSAESATNRSHGVRGAPDTPNRRNPASIFLPRTAGWSAATLHQAVTTEGRPPDALTFSRCLVLPAGCP